MPPARDEVGARAQSLSLIWSAGQKVGWATRCRRPRTRSRRGRTTHPGVGIDRDRLTGHGSVAESARRGLPWVHRERTEPDPFPLRRRKTRVRSLDRLTLMAIDTKVVPHEHGIGGTAAHPSGSGDRRFESFLASQRLRTNEANPGDRDGLHDPGVPPLVPSTAIADSKLVEPRVAAATRTRPCGACHAGWTFGRPPIRGTSSVGPFSAPSVGPTAGRNRGVPVAQLA